ncbi:Alpha/Beta hydrolase protein [Xylogone sp. PMI_703]|nr:Alpha/Beta hydrolase protein [Xylogone sp. PMI_703]
MHYSSLLLSLGLGLGVTASVLPHPACKEVKIPVTVNVPRFILSTSINDDWDTASLTLNLTTRDFANSSSDPLPVIGSTSKGVKSSYTIGGTLCGSGGTLLVLTHGIIESKLYWNPNFPGSESYNFIDAALKAGYSILSYDRIGVATSSKVDPISDAQFQVETAVLNSLISYGRKATSAKKVALVGHSYGAYLSAASASQVPVDAVVLTGFSGTFDYFAPFIAGASFRIAKLQNPLRWGGLHSGYITSADLYALTYVYFASNFDRSVAEWTFNTESEPFALGELPSLLATTITYSDIKAPVLVLQGRYDVSACGGDCVGLLEKTKSLFTGSKTVETVDNLPAGHNLNLHKVAPQAFQMIFSFLKKQGL